ncbi:type III-B CRISPR-associated protein Cas10/Cmr2 [Thermodesulfobacterium thermophilum]|uniref:type III-B CRISPR-associated protein Cas10/Cmr2 n=1 Tax=Thermodesulfobacterium thermophilum TaxID=886 RepID=UPI0003B6D8EA|nr:type III-B CRISPR-associated protein Cas10/Cmr2 [Thermodesulfobacterium thermophilum]
MSDYLCLITIPSIGKLIKYSRRTEDLWAGSMIVASLIKSFISEIKNKYAGRIELIFPSSVSKDQNSDFADISNKVLFKVLKSNEKEIKAIAGEIEAITYKGLSDLVDSIFRKCGINIDDYKVLAYHQAKSTIKLFWAALPVEGDYKATRQHLDAFTGYLKDAYIKNDEVFQSYKLIKRQKPESSFDNYQNTEDYEKYCRGAYTCTVCKENTIIGATEKDYKGSDFWRQYWKNHKAKFKEGERLCGFCLIKRFLAEYLKKQSFPSTSEMAATVFKKQVIDNSEALEELTRIFEQVINKLPRGNSVKKLGEEFKKKSNQKNIELLKIDGEWFMIDTWKNPNTYAVYGINDDEAKRVCSQLEDFYKSHKKPSEMYAIFKLDGDNMGAKISALDKKGHKKLSELQYSFVEKAKEFIYEYYGAPVYIGGDDIFAFLPVEYVLECAKSIRSEYEVHMKEIASQLSGSHSFTMSGAILVAHHLLPLQYLIKELYEIEKEAKSQKGKDSIGIKFIKHSLSSDEVILKWDKLSEFERLRDIPKSFIYQLSSVSNVFEDKDGLNEFHARQAFIRSLLKRKVKSDRIEGIIDQLIEVDKLLNFNRLSSLLSILHVIKGGD